MNVRIADVKLSKASKIIYSVDKVHNTYILEQRKEHSPKRKVNCDQYWNLNMLLHLTNEPKKK